jgi:hypothetical protein
MQSSGVKIVNAKIPPETENLDSWISDNYEKLVTLPVPFDELTYSYEVMETSEDDGVALEIRLVRQKECERIKEFFKLAGLQLLALNIGTVEDNKEEHRVTEIIAQFGVSSEYALAVNIACQGFSQRNRKFDILDTFSREFVLSSLYKRVSRRAIILFGTLIVFVLAIMYVFNIVIDRKLEAIENSISFDTKAYCDVETLEAEVRSLESKLHGSSAIAKRSTTAKLLHEVATLAPDGVWFDRLSLGQGVKNASSLSISGVARSNWEIADFLRKLQSSAVCTNVKLIRSGSASSSDGSMEMRKSTSSLVAFELTALTPEVR